MRFNERMRWLTRHSLPLFFLGFFIFLVGNNTVDWDVFRTGLEVESQSWTLEHRPPIWSYQYCGGAPRAGDPQAFGLSPFILLSLLFGSFWGSKLIYWFCSVVGFVYSRRLFALFFRSGTDPSPPLSEDSLTALVLLYVFSSFFLWHGAQGHLTFALMYFGMAIIYYTFKARVGEFERSDYLPSILLTWAFYSAGLYAGLVYLLLPFFFAQGLDICFVEPLRLKVRGQKWRIDIHGKRIFQAVTFHLAGMIAGGYKLYYVIAYQHEFPRTVPDTFVIGHWWDSFFYQLLPMMGARFLGHFKSLFGTPSGGEEAFNLFAWVLVIYLFFRFGRRNRRPVESHREKSSDLDAFLWVYGITLLLFALGKSYPWTPHAILAHYIFHDSIRVVQRYQIGVTLWLALVTIRVLAHDSSFREWLVPQRLAWLVVIAGLNFFTFRGAMFSNWDIRPYLRVAEEGTREMQSLEATDTGDDHPEMNFMWNITRSGRAVLNCYDPMIRDEYANRYIADEWEQRRIHFPIELPFVAPEINSPSGECRQRSYFTQNRIYIDPSCPKVTCVNLNAINPFDPHPGVSFNPRLGKLCTGT